MVLDPLPFDILSLSLFVIVSCFFLSEIFISAKGWESLCRVGLMEPLNCGREHHPDQNIYSKNCHEKLSSAELIIIIEEICYIVDE